MAERVDAIAVDVRDRAGRAHLEVAADERDADRVPFTQRPGRLLELVRNLSAERAAEDRRETSGTERSGKQIRRFGLEAADDERGRDRPKHRAELCAGGGRHPEYLHVGGAVGERRDPPIRRDERGRQPFTRDRQLDARLRPRAARHLRRVLHLGDRRNPGNRFGREGPDRVRHRADQAAVDVDRAAAHARGHSGLRERSTLEAREDEVAVRTLDVPQDPENVDLELLKIRPLEDGAPDTDHARLDLADRHQRGDSRQRYPAEDGKR